MGDLPEPKLVQGQGARGLRGSNMTNSSLDQDLVLRQDRRLSHMVGLDQVGITGISSSRTGKTAE